MRHFLITVIGTIVGIFAFFIGLFFLLAIIGAAATGGKNAKAQGDVLLTLDLRKPLRDHNAAPSLFGPTPSSVVDIVRALDRAKDDDKVKGLFIRANSYGMAPAAAEEINLVIRDFKDSGKFVITHSQGFESTSIIPYYVVSGSDEIWMQDTTSFSSAGLHSEIDFWGGVFEKYDVQTQFVQFHEYKTAANTYTQSGLTEAHREATTAYISSIYDHAVNSIAENRELTSDNVEAVFLSAPHTAESARDADIIDRLGHVHEALKYAKEKAGKADIRTQSVQDYGPPGYSTGPAIAFIGGQGPVVMGTSEDGSNPFSNSLTMGGDTVTGAFDAAIKDKNVKAIVFRVSTPGGSATASDQIDDAVKRAKAAGKPVVISMGTYAASGGYYVSMNADKILALNTTITGSIGVLAGKLALRDTFAKFGYNIEAISVGGEYAGAYSGDEPFTEAQYEAFRQQMEDIYVDFTTGVAEGRDLELAHVLENAKGRVWTGEQAKPIGLVDEFGGILKAIDVARELAEIEDDAKIYLKTFPRPKTTQQQLEELFGASAQISEDLALLRELKDLPEVQALLKAKALREPDAALRAELPVVE